MSEPLATLRDYGDPYEAELVRGLLESHGIAVFLADENITRLYVKLPIFAVRLQVLESDLPAARQILETALLENLANDDNPAGDE